MNFEDNAKKMHDNPDPAPEQAELDETDEDDEEPIEEYADLDEALNQIGSYLDQLEQKNDSIYARLQELLEQNRETRKELEAERLNGEHSGVEKDPDGKQSGSS